MADEKSNPYSITVIAIGLGGLALSLLLLFVAQFVTDSNYAWFKLLLQSVASTIMVAATVGLLVERLTKKELIRMMEDTNRSISQQMGTLRALDELGLIDAHSDVNSYPFTSLILSTSAFIAVLNDGKSWVGRNAGDVRKRLLIPNLKTTFILQHPNSPMIDILAAKVQQSPDFLREKIADTVRELNSFDKAESHTLCILGHEYFNVHSLFITDEHIAQTPYLTTHGRNTVPVFIFERRGPASQYQRWYDDIKQLIKVSKPLIPKPDDNANKLHNMSAPN